MNDLKRKIKSGKGETIVEVLVSLLVTVLAIALLFGMVHASSHMIDQSRSVMQAYYTGANFLAEMPDPASPVPEGTAVVSGTVTLRDSEGTAVALVPLSGGSLDVTYYINALGTDEVASYRYQE